MNKILGIFALLVFVCVFTTVLSGDFVKADNMYNITRWSALFGILSIGVAFVIITGGIDLSIGSVVGLLACILPMLLTEYDWSPATAICLVMGISLGIGLLHGLLITKLELQPFVVTLCGLLFYRGFARWLTSDQTQGFGQDYDALRLLAIGKPLSVATLLMVVGAAALVVFLLRGVWFWARKDLPRRNAAFVYLAAAALLAVIGAARFLHGYELQAGMPLLTMAGYQLKSVSAEVPVEGRELPAMLMFWAGLATFIPAAALFLVGGLRRHPRRTWPPTIALLLTGGMFAASLLLLAPIYHQTNRGDLFRFGLLVFSGAAYRGVLMLTVFVSTGLFMGALTWLSASVQSTGEQARRLLPVVLFGGVLWLTGMTKLPETMVPMPMLLLFVCAILAAVFLNQTIYGRYLLALGRNEEAARYSGIRTDRMVILAYVICSGMAGLGAILLALDINSVQPSGFGNFYELYAIAAAVLGGCSLRGGEGSILGVVIGAAVMRVLRNAINILGIATQLEFAIIGLVILIGAVVDVLVKRVLTRRRAKLQAQQDR